MKEIAKKAYVGEKSIYRYFSSKTELTVATVSILWNEIVSELIASIDDDYETKNGLAQVESLVYCFQNLFTNNYPYVLFSYDYKLFMIRNNAFLTETEYVDEIKPIQNMYIHALKKGMKDGSICIKGDAEEIYYAIWGLIRGYIVKIVIYDSMYQGKNMWRTSFKRACSLVINGLQHKEDDFDSSPISKSG